MSADVPSARPGLAADGISFGRAVRSFDWIGAAALANYDRGRGAVLVPQTLIMETIALGPNTGTYHFWVQPNPFSYGRIYLIALRGATAAVPTQATITVNGGASITRWITGARAEVVPIEINEDIASPNNTAFDLIVTVASSTTAAVEVVSIAIYEKPCPWLDTSGAGGVDLASVAPVQPVTVNTLGLVANVTGKPAAGTGALNATRRAGMHYWVLSSGGNGKTGVGGLTTLYTASGGAPALGRYLYNGDTTRNLTFKAYGKVSAAATFTVKLTMTSGATTSITTTSASAGWFGGSTIAVDAEDLTAVDGRRSTRWDEIKVEYGITGGAGTFFLWGVSVYEDLQ